VHSVTRIEIAAPPDLVYRLARDVTRWERLLPHYSRSSVAREAGDVRVCDFIARRPFVPLLGIGIPVTWRSRTWHDPETRRLYFAHVAGATKGMDVVWTIEARGDRTCVEISHDFRPRVPGSPPSSTPSSPARSPGAPSPPSRPSPRASPRPNPHRRRTP